MFYSSNALPVSSTSIFVRAVKHVFEVCRFAVVIIFRPDLSRFLFKIFF